MEGDGRERKVREGGEGRGRESEGGQGKEEWVKEKGKDTNTCTYLGLPQFLPSPSSDQSESTEVVRLDPVSGRDQVPVCLSDNH